MIDSPTTVPNLVHKRNNIYNRYYRIPQIQLFQFGQRRKSETHFEGLGEPLQENYFLPKKKKIYKFTTDHRQQIMVVDDAFSIPHLFIATSTCLVTKSTKIISRRVEFNTYSNTSHMFYNHTKFTFNAKEGNTGGKK